MAERCAKCGELVQIYYFCDDDDDVGGPYCVRCFDKHPCRTEPHEEGCETQVLDTDPEEETGHGKNNF